MRADKKRIKEINQEMEAIMEAMKVASEQGDWDRYMFLQETYNKYLTMQLSIGESKADKAGNKIGIAKLFVDLLGVAGTVFVGILGIRTAADADVANKMINQRPWNIGFDFIKRNK